MSSQVDQRTRDRVARHYAQCAQVLRAVDLDGFLNWLRVDGTFPAIDGSIVRVADTRPFWAWRFGLVLAVRRCEMEVEDVTRNDEGLLAVDFREWTDLTLEGLDGVPVERDADLRNRNLWELDDGAFTTRGGEELRGHRTLNGQPLTDVEDPWGFAAWAQFRDSQQI